MIKVVGSNTFLAYSEFIWVITFFDMAFLKADNINIIRWWVDASDRTHDDCKGHSGVLMTMGKGAIVSKSLKQKINTKSSTESELVALDSALPKILWCLYFVELQGYSIDENVVFQDNLSTMR